MGHQTGIVASNVPPQFKAVTFAQRLNHQMPLDTMLKDEAGPAWLEELDLRHVWVDVTGRTGGSL